jgi:AsmA-like C-terminal region
VAAPGGTPARYRLRLWLLAAGIAVVALAGVAVFVIDAHWPYRYRIVKPILEGMLGSQIEIAHYHRTYFPHPGFVAENLTLRRKSASNPPPLGSVGQLAVQGNWSDLFLLRPRVRLVDLQKLHVVIPAPGTPASREDFPPGSASDYTGPETLIERLKIHDSLLEIQRQGATSLLFPIKELDIRDFQKMRAIRYVVDMQNAVPRGHIVSSGSFGPLNASDLGATPVSGTFTFSSVNLHDVGDINGTMASHGRFWGSLQTINAEADSDTPQFAVDDGTPTPVRGSVQCAVNGLTGEVALQRIEVQSAATMISAHGSVTGSPKATNLEVAIREGRAQDVLRPFLHSSVPITGQVQLHGHVYLAPAQAGVGFLQRLRVDGGFDVPAERATDTKTEKTLTDFSRRVQGQKNGAPNNQESSNASADALSTLKGPAQIRDGVVSSPNLTFAVPGAQATLQGTFRFHDQAVHLTGILRLQAGISHAFTGFKSFLLKPLDPFFKKEKAGAVVPIAVVGSPGHYQVTQDLGHKK